MIRLRHSQLVLLLCVACTSIEPTMVQEPDPSPEDPSRPVTAAPSVTASVASVRLDSDCPDPPGASASAREGEARESAKSESKRSVSRDDACEQSTMQLRLDNAGAAAARIRVAAIALRDVQSEGIVAAVPSRGPSSWAADGTYVPWDEQIAAGAQMQVSYRLTPPDWTAALAKLGGVTSAERDFVLEVTLQIDDKPLTVRSPAFRRPAPERLEVVET